MLKYWGFDPTTHEVKKISRDEWVKLMDDPVNRRVALDQVKDVRISTVFLGIDHNFTFGGRPVLFETMTFGNTDELEERYCTWDEAVEGHERAVRMVEEQLGRLRQKGKVTW